MKALAFVLSFVLLTAFMVVGQEVTVSHKIDPECPTLDANADASLRLYSGACPVVFEVVAPGAKFVLWRMDGVEVGVGLSYTLMPAAEDVIRFALVAEAVYTDTPGAPASVLSSPVRVEVHPAYQRPALEPISEDALARTCNVINDLPALSSVSALIKGFMDLGSCGNAVVALSVVFAVPFAWGLFVLQ